MIVIRAVKLEGFADSGPYDVGGQWLMRYDVEAFDGRGEAVFTDKKEEALKFKDIGEAFEAWKKQSVKRPLRPDGQANRPLTAFTITFEPWEPAP